MAAIRCVALLRGVNVGRVKRIAMADLRRLVEELGFTEVKTLLNSGNVVFTAAGRDRPKAAQRIEQAIAAQLGFTSRVTVLTSAEMAAVVAGNPLLDVIDDPARFLVAALSDPADRALLAPLAQQQWAPDALALGERVAYLWCCGGILESRLLASCGRLLGDRVTTRNWTTILKLHALMQG